MNTLSLRPLAVLIAGLFSTLAFAENTVSLDSVVVTGSRVEHSSFDLPAAVDVVARDRIGAAQAGVNASEALVAVPGLTVQNRQNYAQDLQISSRGFGSRAAFGVRGIRLMADGIPASTPDGQGQAATFNLDRAERIEVMRGPMSTVYGNASGGVIQLFTADGKGAPSIEGGFSAGSYGMWKADLSAQGEVNGIGYVVDASRFETDGYRDHSSARRDQSFAKLTTALGSDSKLTLVASTFRQEAEDPQGLAWSQYQSDRRGVSANTLLYNTRKSIDSQQGGATFEQKFGANTLQLSGFVGQRSVIQYQSIPAAVQGNPKHSGGIIDFDRTFAGASARWIGRYDVAGGRMTTTLGMDYEQSTDDRRGYENFIGATLGVKGNLRRQEDDRVASFDQYAQAEWQGQQWSFTGGLRHSRVSFKVEDHYIVGTNGNDSGTVNYEKTTPMLGAMYRLSEAANLYVTAARGFETPTFNELFYSSPTGSFSFDLKPSTSTHLEAGLKAIVGNDSRLDLAVFQVKTQDELVVTSSVGGRTSYINAGETLRRGIEAAVDSRWGNNISSRLAYTYLDATYDQDFTTSSGVIQAGNHMPGVARQTLFAELAWKHPASGFSTALEGIARDKVYVEDSNAEKAAPGYAIANVRLGFDGKSGPINWKTFLRVDNIFDRDYVGSVIVSEGNKRYYESAPGRQWLLGASLRYGF